MPISSWSCRIVQDFQDNQNTSRSLKDSQSADPASFITSNKLSRRDRITGIWRDQIRDRSLTSVSKNPASFVTLNKSFQTEKQDR